MENTKTALISGASGEIGGAIAASLAGEGYRLYLCGRNTERLDALARDLSEKHEIYCVPLSFDVSNPSAVDSACERIPALDILVNCAGIAHFSLLQDTADADWDRILSTNLSGAFYLTRRLLPLLLASQGSRIINISSVWGSRGAAMESAYSASKAGLDALTRSLALELAPRGIPVNAIACGVIDTGMNRSHLTDQELKDLMEEIPAGRFGRPEEVGELVRLLLKAPSYLTGQIITMSGGW